MGGKKMQHLYLVTMNGGRTFYVVATDESTAARLAEKTWLDWDYISEKGIATGVEMIAFGSEYTPNTDTIGGKVPWLLLSRQQETADGK